MGRDIAEAERAVVAAISDVGDIGTDSTGWDADGISALGIESLADAAVSALEDLQSALSSAYHALDPS
jgi:hypothetical protein